MGGLLDHFFPEILAEMSGFSNSIKGKRAVDLKI